MMIVRYLLTRIVGFFTSKKNLHMGAFEEKLANWRRRTCGSFGEGKLKKKKLKPLRFIHITHKRII